MNPVARAARQLWAEVKALPFYAGSGGSPGGWITRWNRPSWRWSWHQGAINYAKEVGDPGSNSAVAACVNWIATAFPEAPLRVLDAKGEPIPDHPMLDLIDNPNDFYDGNLLLQCTLTDYTVAGNAFWLIVPNGQGRPVQLWYAPSWMVTPRWDMDGTEFLSHYEYNPNGTPIDIPIERMVHFRNGLDPTTRLGVSRLASALGEIFTDQEAQAYTSSILHNLGVPGVILAPKAPDVSVDKESADAIRDDFNRRFGGDNRGSVMVMHEATDVSVLSFNPQQMELKSLRRIPEERISAILGIPAIVAGLGAGLDRSTFANFAEAREMAYESCIIPLQRFIAAAIRRQLLRHFTTDKRVTVDFDLSQVRVLAEDETGRAERMIKQFDASLITMAEARRALSWEVFPEHELYKVDGKFKLVPPDQLETPEPEPLAPAPTLTEVPPAQLPAGNEDAAKALHHTIPLRVGSADELEQIYEERLRRALSGNGNGH